MEELIKKAKSLGADFKIEVESGEETIVGFLKKPSRVTLSAVIKLLETDTIKANETLLKTCIIKEVSDMRLVEDDDIFLSVLPQLQNLIALKKSTLTTL
jgi:hypothetical protein